MNALRQPACGARNAFTSPATGAVSLTLIEALL